MWSIILKKAQGDTEQIKQLLSYVEQYSKPELIIEALSPEARFSEIKDAVVEAFRKLKNYKFVLKAALKVSEKEKFNSMSQVISENKRGMWDFYN